MPRKSREQIRLRQRDFSRVVGALENVLRQSKLRQAKQIGADFSAFVVTFLTETIMAEAIKRRRQRGLEFVNEEPQLGQQLETR